MIKELITLAEIELLTGNGSQKEKQRLISENLTEEMLMDKFSGKGVAPDFQAKLNIKGSP